MFSALINLINTSLIIATVICITGVITKPDDSTFINYLKFQLKTNIKSPTGLFATIKSKIISSKIDNIADSGNISIIDHIICKTAKYKYEGHTSIYFIGMLNNWYIINPENKLFIYLH